MRTNGCEVRRAQWESWIEHMRTNIKGTERSHYIIYGFNTYTMISSSETSTEGKVLVHEKFEDCA